MFYANLILIIGLSVFAISFSILAIFRFRKNRFYYPFEEDKLIATKKDEGYKNYIYSTKGETSKYINKYVISRSSYDNTLICNFNEHYDDLSYFIVEYGMGRKPLRVLEVYERFTSFNSRVIVLSKSCLKVNVYIKSVNNVDINGIIIKPLSKKEIGLYSFFSSLLYLGVIFVADYFIPQLILGENVGSFWVHWLNLAILGFAIVIFIFHWATTYSKTKNQNLKNRSEGVVDYEFY